MKKKILATIITIAGVILIGCSSSNTTKADNNKFIEIYSEGSVTKGYTAVYVDSDTGVEYIVVSTGSGPAITPRYDSMGKIMVEDKYKK